MDRVLLVESGSRDLIEELLPGLYKRYGDKISIDLVTCYAGRPKHLDPDAAVYRVTDYVGAAARKNLYQQLRTRNYSVIGIMCTDEPIMTKWKWALAHKVPAKLFILNENGDYFWVQWSEWATMRHFVLFRAGLTDAGAVRTLARVLLFPFSVLYLVLWASLTEARRSLRPRRSYSLRHS
ncbi:MAG TPA: hypothetical protein VE621_22030 [Bryobacteraceae bacterium]|jgi:hypothetical protein|nr:hypothetical protein [Bryobacteraceae bacterium]